MATQLYNIVRFAGIAPATPTALPHGLNVQGRAEIPDLVFPSSSGWTVAVDATNVTVTNNGTVAASIDVWVEIIHSYLRAFGPSANIDLPVKPFFVQAAGANGVVLNAQQTFTAGQAVAQVTLVAAANVAISGADSNNFEIELDQNVQLDNPTNVVPGMTINIAVRQDGAGAHVQTFGSAYLFDAAAVPALPVGANDEYLISCYVRAVAAGVATVMSCARTGAVT